MEIKIKSNKIAILVLSFDGYEDLWSIFIELFNKNWPDCNFDKYLMTNYKNFTDNDAINPFKPLKIGKDNSWSKNLMTALDLLHKYEYVFLFMEDGFLIKKVNNYKVLEAFDSFDKLGGKFLSYLNEPKPNKKFNKYFGEVTKDSPYRVTATSSLWNIKFLRNFLVEDEDAWMFEKIGARRSEVYDSGFYSVYSHHFYYIHGIIKGSWLPDSYKALSQMGFDLSASNRDIFSKNQIIKMQIYTFFRNVIFFLTPFKLRKFLVRYK